MLDYLQKYQQVPLQIREKLNSLEVRQIIKDLEVRYQLSLSVILIKVMVKDIALNQLPIYLVEYKKLDQETAQKLAAELQINIFNLVSEHFSSPTAQLNIEKIIDNQILPKTNAKSVFSKSTPSLTMETALNKIISQQSIVKKPTELTRLRQVVKTFLLSVRDQIAVVDFLIKPLSSGGLGMNSEQAEKLITEIIIVKEELDQQTRQQVNVQPPISPTDALINQQIVQDFESELLNNLKKTEQLLSVEAKTKMLSEQSRSKELSAPKDLSSEIKKLTTFDLPKTLDSPASNEPTQVKPVEKELQPSRPVKPEPFSVDKKTFQPTVVVPLDQRSTDSKTGKIKMDDVRFSPKTLTPVDELATITLRRFRYLGSTPQERVQKVRQKIDLLAEYSYSKRLQGINAWRQSPLNLLYLEVGQISITTGQTAQEILTQQANENKEALTFDEFKAIMDLNKQIRF